MKNRLTILLLSTLAFVVLGITIMFNRSQPSALDTTMGAALASSAKRAVANDKQQVFYEASRDQVVINAYGFSDTSSQEKVLEQVRGHFQKEKYEGKVAVYFFPPREYAVEKQSDGGEVKKLKKASPIRHVELN